VSKPRKLTIQEKIDAMSPEEKALGMCRSNPLVWIHMNKIYFRENMPYQLKYHSFQGEILQCMAQRQCMMKGAQQGYTAMNTLRVLHGMIFNKYPQGVFYLFPTATHATDFSREKFDPLIACNPSIAMHVSGGSMKGKKTDNASMKKVGNSFLYLRGARVSQKIGGESGKKSSVSLKSNSADCVVFDEVDEMDQHMVSQAIARMFHSEVKEERYLSTPTIDDFGIAALYNKSDQRVWMIKCKKCNGETCLELEFPDCIREDGKGGAYRACRKCGEKIYPQHGKWVTRYPDKSKDMVGWWTSNLISHYVQPIDILEAYRNPPNGNMSEVYNSMLGMPYTDIENRLTENQVLSRCGSDAMAVRDDGPTAMGVDTGKRLHVVIGQRTNKRNLKILKVTNVDSFNDLHDLGKRYKVRCAVIDKYPETHAARAFGDSESYKVYLCGYQDGKKQGGTAWDERGMEIRGNRTELLDASHSLVSDGSRLELPRMSDEIERYAKQMTGVAKVLEEDQETGAKIYRYRKMTGGIGDHYRHATNYFMLASERIGVTGGNKFIQLYNERKFGRRRGAMAA